MMNPKIEKITQLIAGFCDDTLDKVARIVATEEKVWRPGVGQAIIVEQNGSGLVGKRKGAEWGGCWVFPGGHLEHNETLVESIARETFEETGLVVDNLEFVTITNDALMDDGLHYVT